MVTVNYDDLSEAFDFVSSSAPTLHSAFISLDTDAIYWVSEKNPVDEEVPDDIQTSDRYLPVPQKNDLDLGSRLVLRFVAEEPPDEYERVQSFFRQRGAYARLKGLLAVKGRLEKWYAFEAAATETAVRQWCAKHDIQVTGSKAQPSA